MLAKTAGIKHLVVLINKMDDSSVEWSKERYPEFILYFIVNVYQCILYFIVNEFEGSFFEMINLMFSAPTINMSPLLC